MIALSKVSPLAGSLAVLMLVSSAPALSHKLREGGEAVKVADSMMTVVPGRDWNRLDGKIGKNTERWTLDGPQLNDVIFYGGIEPGKPLLKERSKKRDPLPKFTKSTLLIEVPELLEGTYRTYHELATFDVLSATPATFLGRDGIGFTYRYTDKDNLTRNGEARATIVDGALYMVTFDAPRLHYSDRALPHFRTIADSAAM